MVEWLLLFLQIMMINIVLSGDNAVVIAMASRNLPLHQRKKAVWWGVFGAIALRLILTVVAVTLLRIPYIQALGSFLLLWIAVKLLIDDHSHAKIRQASTLGKAIWTIIIADFVMSLDNVLAIAAKANNNMTIVILGIGLSIPIIIWGSSLVMGLLRKYPIFIYLGAGVLGYTAGEMFIHDQKVIEYILSSGPMLQWLIPIFTTTGVIIIGLISKMAQPKDHSGHIV